MTKVRGVSGQVEQMKQLTMQLKKGKDTAMQKVNGLEKRIADVISKIQVNEFILAYDIHCVFWCCLW